MTKQKEQHIRFRHFHIPEINYIPSVTLSAERVVNDIEVDVATEPRDAWVVSWAVCNPEDNFSRQVGREIALASQEERGIKILISPCESPFDAAVEVIMKSDVISVDGLKHLRYALELHTTPDVLDEINYTNGILEYLYERMPFIFAK